MNRQTAPSKINNPNWIEFYCNQFLVVMMNRGSARIYLLGKKSACIIIESLRNELLYSFKVNRDKTIAFNDLNASRMRIQIKCLLCNHHLHTKLAYWPIIVHKKLEKTINVINYVLHRSNHIEIQIIDNESYEKDTVFYVELGEPEQGN